MDIIKQRNEILKKVSDRVIREVPLNVVFNLLVGELKEGKSTYKTYKNRSESPCCGSDGFTIHKNTNLFKCYSCGKSGSVITLTRIIFRSRKYHAVDWLINRFKIDIKDIIHDYKVMYTPESYKDWLDYKDNSPF